MNIFIVILAVIYIVSLFTDVTTLGAGLSSPWYCLFTYSFIHANIFHVSVNAVFLWLYWKNTRFIPTKTRIVYLAVIPAIAAALSLRAVPTVGASAAVMTLAGILVAWFPRRLILRTTIIIVLSSLATFLFAPHINTPIHLYSFGFAFAAERLRRYLTYVRKTF